jgi:hypothetical protein
MLLKLFIFNIGFCMLTGCTSHKNTRAHVKNARGIELAEGQTKLLREYPLHITFKGISEDSRCPEGINCIWAGVAAAEIEVTEKTAKSIMLTLATTDMQEKGYRRSAQVNGYIITLQSVAPYPTAEQGVQRLKGNYKIGIVVQKK